MARFFFSGSAGKPRSIFLSASGGGNSSSVKLVAPVSGYAFRENQKFLFEIRYGVVQGGEPSHVFIYLCIYVLIWFIYVYICYIYVYMFMFYIYANILYVCIFGTKQIGVEFMLFSSRLIAYGFEQPYRNAYEFNCIGV